MITLYGLSNCDTCRKARKWLERFGVPHRFIDYREQPQSPATLSEWKEQVGGWDLMINKSSTTWRNLSPHRKRLASDPEWIVLLREYPQLIRRPLLVTEDGIVSQGFSDNGFKQRFEIGRDA